MGPLRNVLNITPKLVTNTICIQAPKYPLMKFKKKDAS